MKKKNTLEAFSAIANAYEIALFEYQPELGIFWGKSDVALDRFMDSSIEGYQHWWQQEDDFLTALSALDMKSFQNSSQ